MASPFGSRMYLMLKSSIAMHGRTLRMGMFGGPGILKNFTCSDDFRTFEGFCLHAERRGRRCANGRNVL